jgi:hypothetical protein
VNGFLQKVMGKKFDNNVYKLNNGYLASINLTPKDLIPQFADNMISLKSKLQERNIDLLYIQAPAKLSKYDNQLPVNITDYSNDDCDNFLKLIRNSGVDCIDLRVEMYNEGINHYDMFFKTDHHWTPEAGLWAAGKISEFLNDEYNYNIDISLFNRENFDYVIYENSMLGSLGRRVGIFFAGLDDITIITPKFCTIFFTVKNGKEILELGNFKSAFLDLRLLNPDNIYIYSGYDAYTTANFPVYNRLIDGKNILLVSDSFAGVFAPFLSLGCSSIDAIFLSNYNKGTLIDYIDEINPDAVIFLYTSSYDALKMFTFE